MSDSEETPTPLPRPVSDAFAPTVESDVGDENPDGREDLRTAAAEKPLGSNAQERAGTIVGGRYKLLNCIGEGGMGSVWRAEQHEPVRRTVAVKLIKAGMDSRAVLARFDAERQALAVMDHPNIARIFDAGVTDSGAPFFVMELVKGVPITHFCDSKQLNPKQRLELFIPVCQAIQHAHQKGIIHRDIKPSNVIVAMYDDRPVPKVIDFGVAKATGTSLTEFSLDTGLGNVVGTPQYMSPEQASLNNQDIDTRSDVYSLGVLMYELLTGSTPFRRHELEKAGLLEVLRVIREEDPPRPSTKLSTADTLPNLSANRSMEPKALTMLLRRELDWIVMKALDKDRVRRYDSANGLAADIGRYLNGEAVQAHPPTRRYRLAKFLRKNKGPVIAASVVILALVGGVIGTTYGLLRAEQQRAVAELNLKTAEDNYQLSRGAVDRYLTQVGDNRLLNEPYMDELRHELLKSAREFYQEFADRRRGDRSATADLAAAHAKLADISWSMGLHDEALEELEASRAAVLRVGPEAAVEVVQIRTGIRTGSYLLQLGRIEESAEVLDQTLKDAERRLETLPNDPETRNLIARTLDLRGTINRRQNKIPEATADYSRAAEILEQLMKDYPQIHEYSRDLTNIYTNRGQLAYHEQENDAAEDWHRKALAIRRAIASLEPDSIEAISGLATGLSNLGGVLRRKQKHAEAIALGKEAIDIARVLVKEHPGQAKFQNDLAGYLSNQAVILKVSGASAEADILNAEAIALMTRMVQQFPSVTGFVYSLGTAEGNEGNSRLASKAWDEAILWFDRSIATLLPLLEKSEDPRVRVVLRNNYWGRADALVELEKFSEAVKAFDKTIEMADERNRPEIRMARAMALARSGDHKAARLAVETETSVEDVRGLACFDGAKVLAAASVAARNDNDLTEAERAAAAEELSTASIAALHRAFDLGYFGNQRTHSQLQPPNFAPLQDRADFKELTAQIQGTSREVAPKNE